MSIMPAVLLMSMSNDIPLLMPMPMPMSSAIPSDATMPMPMPIMSMLPTAILLLLLEVPACARYAGAIILISGIVCG